MTDPLGQSQVLPYLKGLSAAGYEIHLVSFEKSDRFLAHKKHIRTVCNESGIIWHPQDYHNEGGLKKTLRQVWKMKRVTRYLHDRHQFDIVHCRSYISAIAGLMMKRKFGVRFVFDMRGFWADERVDGGLWNLKNPLFKTIYNYFKRKEKQFLNEADYVISLTENAKKEIHSWNLKTKPQIEVIPCCVDMELFNPKNISVEESEKYKSELHINPDAFVLGYVGSIGTWYMLPEMLDYFKILLKQKPDACFLFITGEAKEKIKQAAEEKGIPSKRIIVKSVLHYQVPAMIALFDASIFFIRPTYSKKASSPTKQGEIMAMGVPIVCNSGVGDTDEIILKYHAGEIVQQFDSESYAKHLIEPANFDHLQITNGAADYFSLEEGVKRYLRVYKSLNG